MAKLIDNDTIQAIANKCDANLTKDEKSRYIAIRNKYKLPFNYIDYENENMIWKRSKELLCSTPDYKLNNGKTVKQASEHSQIIVGNCLMGHNDDEFRHDIDIHISNFRKDYFNIKDFDFITNFDKRDLMSTIEAIYDEIGISPCPSFGELTTIDDYEKYFQSKLGIENVDKKDYANTQRIAKYFDDLFAGVKNKDNAIIAVNEYLNTGDLITLHNNLHA